MNDSSHITGFITAKLYDFEGKLKQEYAFPNLVVTTGHQFIASRIAGVAANVMSHMAVGTTNTAPTIGNTALFAELTRVAFGSATPSGNQVTYVATFGPGVGTGAVVEAGLFNAGSSGTMLARSVFSVINKGAGDSLTFTWTVTVA